MNDTLNHEKALKLFLKQIDCIITDDRKSQINLYAEDIRFEFPFANDRPRLVKGREAFEAIMKPLWSKSRLQGIKVVRCNHEFHATDEDGLYLAIFSLDVEAPGKMISVPFIQLLRIHDNYITEIREYSGPSELSS